MPTTRRLRAAHREKRILGAETPRVFSPSELVQQVVDLGKIAQTIKGGRLDKIMATEGQTLDLEKILRLFNQHGVEFLVVGGYAVAFHGYPRFTRDLELFYHQTSSNAEKILAAFREYGFEGLTLTVADLLHPQLNYKIGYPPNQLDLNPEVKGLDWKKALARSVSGTILGQAARFIDFDSLIDSKTAAGRPQDLVDVDHLMRSLGEF
jgi:hypothetical protein